MGEPSGWASDRVQWPRRRDPARGSRLLVLAEGHRRTVASSESERVAGGAARSASGDSAVSATMTCPLRSHDRGTSRSIWGGSSSERSRRAITGRMLSRYAAATSPPSDRGRPRRSSCGRRASSSPSAGRSRARRFLTAAACAPPHGISRSTGARAGYHQVSVPEPGAEHMKTTRST